MNFALTWGNAYLWAMKAILLPTIAMTIGIGACNSAKTESNANVLPEVETTTLRQPAIGGGRPAAFIPRAVVYKTNGDYNNNVTVVVTDNGTGLITYPAPGDVGEQSVPTAVADGWLWDHRGGIGPNTRFLAYTYAEYHALPEAPSVAQLMAAIIPEARVTAAYRLPIPQPRANVEAIDSIVSSNFKDATVIVP